MALCLFSLKHYVFFFILTEAQSKLMVSKYHIYMMKSGRINMCGLTDKNLDYVANAIKEVVSCSEPQQQQQQQGRL